MAEFPGLGQHCSLESCNRLDYMPFQCQKCEKSFCGDHRFNHGCDIKEDRKVDLKDGGGTFALYALCSAKDCHEKCFDSIRCSKCENNFCNKHRNYEDHGCVEERPKPPVLPKPCAILTKPGVKYEPIKMQGPHLFRMKKIILAKMKMKLSDIYPLNLQVGLNVTLKNGDIYVVVVPKTWTVNRIIPVVMEQCNLNPNDLDGVKLAKVSDPQEEMDYSDPLSKYVTEDGTEFTLNR
jgi:hypothetical protein|uniref:AN1-type domain-containing protein n=1 Tax=Panagrolaimus sp. PS1159 TaxID=55785 RepID=A0AC35G581_9BILA